ncbi:MAG: translation initiation factor IF-2 [Muribaculaceae bacterium]|nr:translation initiation factor IF-2 [Muribaculaceae bacterium]
MAKTKISKLAKDLNVALPTVIEFLRKNNIEIDENPNTRVEDNIAEMLNNEFNKDRLLKNKVDREAQARKSMAEKMKPAPAKEPQEARVPGDNAQKPRFLGKIEIDSKGNPVPAKAAPAPAPAPAPAAPAAEVAPAAEKTAKAEPAPAPAPVKEAPKAEAPKPAKAEAPKAEAPKPEPVKAEAPKPAAPAAEKPAAKAEAPKSAAPAAKPEPPKAEKKAEAPAPEKAAEAPAPEKKEEDDNFIPTNTPKGPTLNIVGKIDLAALNQSTRPKKKSKEDRRRERNAGAANSGANGGGAAGDRKKRKRISGGRVDIAQAGALAAQNGDGRNAQRGSDKKKGPKGPARPVHQEVNEEDVQKQVKETLARLTAKDKNLKKGAKWRKEKREANAEARAEAAAEARAESRVLKLTEFVTANDLALMMDVPINNVIATCMNLGVMVSINQRLDAETINIVAEEFGFKTEYVSAEVADAIHQEEDSEEDLLPRSPIVTVMGHVDHGKTSLLDYIRKANVIAGEAGGITQHIGAYSVTLEDGRHITFLDTPGHEAFTAMRARGAKVTDLCIIIVAADDNVMPQTVEAINHAAAAGVPMVFAINKIDKPHANPDKIKEELAAMNYLVEDWGGKYQSQDISAKKGTGVAELMEKVLLEAELLDLKANPNRNAVGSIIESSLDKGRGYVATVLVQNGTLHQGDIVVAGNNYGKIRAMFNERNQRIKEAGPATPALILGLNGAPQAGDTFNVLDSEQEAREIASKREQLQREQGLRTTKILTLDDIARRRAIGNFQELNIIVKGDVDGSIEALSDSLIKLSTEEIQVNVIHKAVGEISESDVTLAAASDAVIIGFQVRPSLAARRAAEREGVEIRLYSVIYQAIEEVKDAMAGMLAPEIKEEVLGTAEVMETYHISKVGTIAGAMVREGRMKRGCKVRLIRDGIVRYTGELGSLKRFKDDVKEVTSGYDCGLSIAGYNDLKVGDMVEAFEEVEVNRSL